MASPKPPVARGLPFVGNALSMARDVRGFLTRQYVELGPVFGIRVLRRQFTVLAGVEANRFLMREGAKHFRSFEFWTDIVNRYGAARSVISSDGADHAALRKTLKRGYSRQYAADRVCDLADIARREMAEWPLHRAWSVVPALQRIAGRQVGSLVGGVSPHDYIDDLDYFVHVLQTSRFAARPALWSRRFRRASQRMNELYQVVMAQHTGKNRNRNGDDRDLIDDILNMHEADPQFLPEVDLKINALGPYLAALHTVTGTCAFMLYAILKHPDLLAKVQPEADRLFADGTPTQDCLRSLDAMHRTAMETMRMYPAAPVLVRTVTNSFEFAGYRIPAGENVMIATTVPHFLPEYFPEPQRFDIGRYTPERAEHRLPEVYAPFGLGAHRCLGSGFAEVQIAVTMATILHEVELEFVPADYELKTAMIPFLSPSKSFKVRVVRRRGAGAKLTEARKQRCYNAPARLAADLASAVFLTVSQTQGE